MDATSKLISKYLQDGSQCSKNPFHLLPPSSLLEQESKCYKCGASKPPINEKTKTFRSFELIRNGKTGQEIINELKHNGYPIDSIAHVDAMHDGKAHFICENDDCIAIFDNLDMACPHICVMQKSDPIDHFGKTEHEERLIAFVISARKLVQDFINKLLKNGNDDFSDNFTMLRQGEKIVDVLSKFISKNNLSKSDCFKLENIIQFFNMQPSQLGVHIHFLIPPLDSKVFQNIREGVYGNPLTLTKTSPNRIAAMKIAKDCKYPRTLLITGDINDLNLLNIIFTQFKGDSDIKDLSKHTDDLLHKLLNKPYFTNMIAKYEQCLEVIERDMREHIYSGKKTHGINFTMFEPISAMNFRILPILEDKDRKFITESKTPATPGHQ